MPAPLMLRFSLGHFVLQKMPVPYSRMRKDFMSSAWIH